MGLIGEKHLIQLYNDQEQSAGVEQFAQTLRKQAIEKETKRLNYN